MWLNDSNEPEEVPGIRRSVSYMWFRGIYNSDYKTRCSTYLESIVLELQHFLWTCVSEDNELIHLSTSAAYTID